MTSPTSSSAILINDSQTSLNDSRDDKEKLVKARNTPRNNFVSYSNSGIDVRFRVRKYINFIFLLFSIDICEPNLKFLSLCV